MTPRKLDSSLERQNPGKTDNPAALASQPFSRSSTAQGTLPLQGNRVHTRRRLLFFWLATHVSRRTTSRSTSGISDPPLCICVIPRETEHSDSRETTDGTQRFPSSSTHPKLSQLRNNHGITASSIVKGNSTVVSSIMSALIHVQNSASRMCSILRFGLEQTRQLRSTPSRRATSSSDKIVRHRGDISLATELQGVHDSLINPLDSIARRLSP